MKKPSEQIEDAQSELRDTILTALEKFTAETGLSVPWASWSIAHALDSNGHTEAVQYWELRMSLASGMS